MVLSTGLQEASRQAGKQVSRQQHFNNTHVANDGALDAMGKPVRCALPPFAHDVFLSLHSMFLQLVQSRASLECRWLDQFSEDNLRTCLHVRQISMEWAENGTMTRESGNASSTARVRWRCQILVIHPRLNPKGAA